MFSFCFNYVPYVAVIGDIVESKKIKDRRPVQSELDQVLNEINDLYSHEIASKFIITLGDEFQGLLRAGTSTMKIIEKIEFKMYPIRVRFGIGAGEITTDIDPDLSLGADGPAYHNARNMINELKAAEKKKMESKLNMKIEIEDHAEIAELINTVFSLNTVLKAKWTHRQWEIINAYVNLNGTQNDVAQMIGINQSNVQKALAHSNFYSYQKAVNTVAKFLSKIKEQ